jgi:hypothetical protein
MSLESCIKAVAPTVRRRGGLIATLLAAILLWPIGTASADTQDMKKLMKELVPCKLAAMRFCDRSQGINAAALWNVVSPWWLTRSKSVNAASTFSNATANFDSQCTPMAFRQL